MAEHVNIMDFAAGDITPEFNVGPENHFVCVPDIPLGLMSQLAKFKDLRKQVEETGDIDPLLTLFDELLTEDSAHLFRECVKNKIIGIKRIMKIIPWVMEEYGLGRPTQPSEPSSTGSPDGETGSSSEDGLAPSA